MTERCVDRLDRKSVQIIHFTLLFGISRAMSIELDTYQVVLVWNRSWSFEVFHIWEVSEHIPALLSFAGTKPRSLMSGLLQAL